MNQGPHALFKLAAGLLLFAALVAVGCGLQKFDATQIGGETADTLLTTMAASNQDEQIAATLEKFRDVAPLATKRAFLAGQQSLPISKPIAAEPEGQLGIAHIPKCKMRYGCRITSRCKPSWWGGADCSTDVDCPDDPTCG